MRPRGLSLIATLFNAAVIGVIAVVGIMLLLNERARTRDALRVADMAKVRMAFELLYFERNGFAEAAQGCGAVGALVSQCTLAPYLPEIPQLRDPGRFRYEVTTVPGAEDYGISFTLEKRRGTLQAGTHTLTHAGIR